MLEELKDCRIGALNHPQRMLQSGRVSLRQLIGAALVGTVTASE